MNKKLTLSVEDSVISKAKEYAETHNESLSKLVENYFRILITENKREEKGMSGLVSELMGSVKVPEDFDYDEDKREYLEKRYLHD